MTRRIAIVFFAIVTGMLSTKHARADDPLRQDAVKRFGVLEAVPAEKVSAPDVRLGQSLFWDQRLSGNGKTACASCHLTQDWGADHRRFSLEEHLPELADNLQCRIAAVVTVDRRSQVGGPPGGLSITHKLGQCESEVDVGQSCHAAP